MHRSNIQLLQRPHLAFRSKSSGGIHTVENSLPSVYRSLCPYRQRHLHKLRHSSQPRFQPAPSHGLRPLRPPMEPAALRAFRFNRFRSRGPCSSLLEHGRGKRAVRRRRWNFRSRGPCSSLLEHGRGQISDAPQAPKLSQPRLHKLRHSPAAAGRAQKKTALAGGLLCT